jgi:dTDP-4-amino-4,6-dideoxygalactose transaminase
VNVPLLDLVAQHQGIKDSVLPAVMSVIERQGFIMGPEVAQLEAQVARLSGAKHGIACASGTDALLIPLRALGLKPGDEVIAPAFTFFATAAAVEAAITTRTRAIVLVDIFGQMADVGALAALAKKHNLMLVEDAAQAIGARRKVDGQWRAAGELATVGSFSFFPTKNLGAWGDGGMMVAQDDTLADRLRRERLHGGAREYFHDEVGLNSRLDSIQAAVLLAKFPYLAAWGERRREIAARYTAAFAGVAGVTPPPIDPANEHIFHQYTIRADRREALLAHLKSRGIGHKVYYPLALHMQPCFAYLGTGRGALPLTERATEEVVSLPIYPELTSAQQEAVVAAVREFYQG